MKLRNKKTGEIVEKYPDRFVINSGEQIRQYDSLAELNAEWEDAPEEPKGCWIINILGIVEYTHFRNKDEAEMLKEIGNYFETKEEAEKAAEKLKAWKRLKDKGFKVEGWTIDDGLKVSVCTNFDSDGIYDEDKKEVKKDLDICFGGEE